MLSVVPQDGRGGAGVLRGGRGARPRPAAPGVAADQQLARYLEAAARGRHRRPSGPVPNSRVTSRHIGSGEGGDAGAHVELVAAVGVLVAQPELPEITVLGSSARP